MYNSTQYEEGTYSITIQDGAVVIFNGYDVSGYWTDSETRITLFEDENFPDCAFEANPNSISEFLDYVYENWSKRYPKGTYTVEYTQYSDDITYPSLMECHISDIAGDTCLFKIEITDFELLEA